VQCWGDKWSQYGLTNVPAQVSNAVEVACGFVDAFARLANGRTVAWGGSFTFSQNYNSPKNQPARELFGIEHMNGGPYFVIGKMNVSPVRGKPPRGTYVDAKWMNSGSIDLRGWNVDTNAYITVQQAQDLGEKSWGDAFTYGYGYGYGAIIRYGYGYGYDGYIERPFLEWSTAMTNRIGFVRIIHTY
jgi:hypothetical protein